MGFKIQLRRGLRNDLPTLDNGELGYTTDTNELFIGTTNYGNKKLVFTTDAAKIADEYEWTASDGQLTYVFPTGKTYDPNSKWLEVVVGGAPVPDSQIQKDNDTQFTLLMDSSKIQAGMSVFARWTDTFIPVDSQHHTTHELGGYDEIDITNLKNYQEKVATPLAEIVKQSSSSAPTTGTWALADKVWNSNPQSGGNLGWICVQAGTFGTGTPPVFKQFGIISA